MKHLGKGGLKFMHCNIFSRLLELKQQQTSYYAVFYSSRGNEEGTYCDETELDINGSFLTFRSDSIFLLFCFRLNYCGSFNVYIWC